MSRNLKFGLAALAVSLSGGRILPFGFVGDVDSSVLERRSSMDEPRSSRGIPVSQLTELDRSFMQKAQQREQRRREMKELQRAASKARRA